MQKKIITIQYSKADLNKIATQKVTAKLPIMLLPLILGVVFAYFIMPEIFSSPTLNVIIGIVVLSFLILGILLSRKMILSQLNKHFKNDEVTDCTIDGQNITIGGNINKILSVNETKTYLLVATSGFQFFPIPKKEFTAEEIKILKKRSN